VLLRHCRRRYSVRNHNEMYILTSKINYKEITNAMTDFALKTFLAVVDVCGLFQLQMS
jgi:hypothetical protein